MRLNRLELVRFGKFTGHELSFGSQPQGGPDLHLVFGPNEAGKTTIATAWLDFLFGVPRNTSHNFLHERKTMRIAADVELDNESMSLTRITTNANSLLDVSDQPVPESVLGGALGGLDRNAYCAMFSLDDETLEQGGDSILQSQGDLGQLLFSASAGLAGLSEQLEQLRKSADSFHRPGARSGQLHDARKKLEHLEAQIKELDTTAPEYTRLREAFEAAQEAAKRANDAYEAIGMAYLLAETKLRLFPTAQKFLDLRHRLSEMAELPPPLDGWIRTASELSEKKSVLTSEIRRQKDLASRLSTRLAQIPLDQAVLNAKPDFDAIEGLKSAYDEAEKDLPTRRLEATEAERAVNALMTRLGAADRQPEDILPDAQIRGRLRDLIVERSRIDAELAAAETELANATAHAEEMAAQLGAAGPMADPDAVETLADLTDRIRAEDPGGAYRRALLESETATADLDDALAALSPWAGTIEGLSKLSVLSPAKTVFWQSALEDAEKAAAEAANEVERRKKELADARIALAEHPLDTAPTLESVAWQRSQRERLWALHRKALTPESADRFEAAMRQDDLISGRLAEARSSAARQSDLGGAVVAAEARCAAAEASLAAAALKRDKVSADYVQAVSSIDPCLAGLTPDALRAWTEQREVALTQYRRARDARNLCTVLSQVRADAETALAGALEAIGADSTGHFSMLLSRAVALTGRHARTASLRDQASAASRAVIQRTEAVGRAKTAESNWQTDWFLTCEETFWSHKSPDYSDMRGCLDVLDQLDPLTQKSRDLSSRIGKMEANRERFLAGVATLADQLGHPDEPAPRRWASMQARYRAAEQATAEASRCRQELEEAQVTEAALVEDLAEIDREIENMARAYHVDSLTELRETLDQAAKRADLARELESLSESLCAGLGVSTSSEAIQELEGIDPVRLTAERDRLRLEREEQERESHHQLKLLADAERNFLAVGGDDAVARIVSERETVLLDIEEEVMKHARLRLGLIAVEDALIRYRETHRSDMMARASEAFRTISRGAYSGLAAQAEGDRDVLMAIAADGASKVSRALSKGTRFQLYLALRIAGYHEIAARRTPTPFIADDILETFDDDRSAETFQLLAQMATRGQVIYFTHHLHLVNIAREVVPGVQVHRI